MQTRIRGQKMYRKHFKAIAKAIQETTCRIDGKRLTDTDKLTVRLADIFSTTNESFDEKKFIEACK